MINKNHFYFFHFQIFPEKYLNNHINQSIKIRVLLCVYKGNVPEINYTKLDICVELCVRRETWNLAPASSAAAWQGTTWWKWKITKWKVKSIRGQGQKVKSVTHFSFSIWFVGIQAMSWCEETLVPLVFSMISQGIPRKCKTLGISQVKSGKHEKCMASWPGIEKVQSLP